MRRALASAVTTALLAAPLAACPAGDDVPEPDAHTAAGLEVTWQTAAAVPGPADATHRVEELALRVSSVSAIGDAAPGDPRTSAGPITLAWGDDAPQPLVFDQAPAGRYSRLELGLGGADEAFELHGEVLLDAAWTSFEIEDEAPIAITVPTAATVAPGARATIVVMLDLAAVLAAIDFGALPREGATLVLHREDPQIAAVRTALAAAFAAEPGVSAPR